MNTDNYNYIFDDIGNRITALSTVDSVTSEMDYLCNALNQYTNIISGTTEQPTYDADGNMTNYLGMTYTWNAENRMTSATNTADGTYITYSYDYDGRMIKKVVDGEQTLYYWNRNHIISEMTDSFTNFYTWANGETLTASLGGETVFYCHDANKNVTDLVDDSGTHLVHYDYSPFGVQSSNVYSSPFTVSLNPFGFSSEYFDSTTGLVEYKYRKYNPYLGKFLSRDPIEEKGGLNLYAICGNDLINKVDINGLWPGVCEDLGEDDVFEDWQFVHVEPVIEQQLVNNGTYFIQEFDVYWIREYKRKYCCCGKEVWRTGYSDKKIELTADNDTGYPYYGMSNPMGVSIVPTALYSQLVTQIGNATSFAPLKTDLHTQDQVRNRAMQNAPKDYEYGNIVAPKTKLCW